jgi:uncharacterized Ntn-hydrolase superfamily protein
MPIGGHWQNRGVAPSTYSIAACDLERAEWGVAVQSKFLAVGALIPWAEPGVGAIATQAWIRASYGADGLRMLRDGLSAAATVDRLVGDDAGRDRRQVGLVDAHGDAAAWTGSRCPGWAGHRTGRGYAAQGNTLVSEATLDALARTFDATAGAPLADRLVACLRAAQDAGGDRRGQQSAAVRVVSRAAGYGGSDIAVDLRVDDHPAPVEELARLRDLHELFFGSTPPELWIPVDEALRAEIAERLRQLGYDSGDLAADIEDWAGVENLEERLGGVESIDPVVLAELRRR